VLNLRKHSNQVLATIIWGNVTTNVLLTLLSDSILAGIAGFLFSAFAITMLGEIIPQAYFSRNALRMTARFLPFLNFYLVVLRQSRPDFCSTGGAASRASAICGSRMSAH
jgi:metal transporter CNNM